MLETVIIVIHLIAALAVIGLVLVQHGKGADMGASFGSGSSNTVFGSQGSANFLSRTTAVLVAVFFVTSVGLAYYAKAKTKVTIFDQTVPVATQPVTTPAQDKSTTVDAAAPASVETTTEQPATKTEKIEHQPAPAPAAEQTKPTKK